MGLDLNAALAALQNSMKNHQAVEIRGEQGPPGERGFPGVDGKDGRDARIEIGRVVSGPEPAARIRFEDGVHYLDLCLPQGSVGPRGLIGLPSDVPGPKGDKGDTPSSEELRTMIRSVIDENRDVLRGPQGERGAPGKDSTVPGPVGPAGASIQGPQGEDGHSVNEDELKAVFIKVLSETGVLTSAQARLIAVRSELRQAMHRASARNQADLGNVYRRIDNIIDTGITD